MPKNKINLYVIGTCRAFRITKTACNGCEKFFILNRGDVFLHSTKEILNVINYQTRKKIPIKHRKYLTIKNEMIRHQKDADIFVIEVSSNRCVEYEGNYFKLVNNNVPNARERIYIMKEEEIIKDLVFIAKKLNKPVIFVSHINILKANGKPVIPQRQYMSETIKKSSVLSSSYFFNPGTYIDQANWLDYVDKELYHYMPFGQETVGNHFREYLMEVCKNEKW